MGFWSGFVEGWNTESERIERRKQLLEAKKESDRNFQLTQEKFSYEREADAQDRALRVKMHEDEMGVRRVTAESSENERAYKAAAEAQKIILERQNKLQEYEGMIGVLDEFGVSDETLGQLAGDPETLRDVHEWFTTTPAARNMTPDEFEGLIFTAGAKRSDENWKDALNRAVGLYDIDPSAIGPDTYRNDPAAFAAARARLDVPVPPPSGNVGFMEKAAPPPPGDESQKRAWDTQEGVFEEMYAGRLSQMIEESLSDTSDEGKGRTIELQDRLRKYSSGDLAARAAERNSPEAFEVFSGLIEDGRFGFNSIADVMKNPNFADVYQFAETRTRFESVEDLEAYMESLEGILGDTSVEEHFNGLGITQIQIGGQYFGVQF